MEAAFIGGKFLEDSLEKNQRYLYKYFSTKVQKQFVRYYLVFRNIDHFTDHTGMRCKKQWLDKLVERFETLESTRKKAQDSGDFELLGQIDAGDFPLD